MSSVLIASSTQTTSKMYDTLLYVAIYMYNVCGLSTLAWDDAKAFDSDEPKEKIYPYTLFKDNVHL